ncbi:MAG: bifunctional (p)ppGpp synthetase/guanosine-3',5'-bis(diphosphate) 3'-pyrophosphohydrolase [Oscillospiraceae bacterium]|jgi:GTP pyrophosphokinase|nr:bifunctional (p)ppGpp synthetase/guanosine-3',5'-bis(diphosphate) 3'-pyrophosphohydrolase [Oscillospiraceae bacterium]
MNATIYDSYNTYESLKLIISNNRKNFKFDVLDKAYEFAFEAHKNQKRYSGIPYIYHSISVAYILAKLGMDIECIIAAILHDVVEDADIQTSQISENFGDVVANLVSGVTKLGKIPLATKEERQAENLRKMLIAIAEDIRVVIIKLSDRLHNMRTIDCMPAQHRRDKSLETMEIYAPIAHRLGIKTIKEELEDISIKILDPEGCKEIEERIRNNKISKNSLIKNIRSDISKRLKTEMKDVFLEGRVKSTWGIYRKVFIENRQIDEVYDMFAIRIIVSTVSECYKALGLIHEMYTPLDKRFKDYISTPKQNLYQSLHTTLIGTDMLPFEVQIRTWNMHYTSEYGIAAHWKYKTKLSKTKNSFEKRIAWVRKIIENQIDNHNVRDLISDIKTDLSPDEVYVFTPKGDVISLPAGSIAIDFAYAIHSEVGHRMIGVKIDKRIVPISTKMKSGQIVEIICSNDAKKGPKRNWLKLVKTGEARNKIRSWFKHEVKEENIFEGKREIEKEILSKIRLNSEEINPFLSSLSKKQKCESIEKFYELVGYGGISVKNILPRIKEEYYKFKKKYGPNLRTGNELSTFYTSSTFSKQDKLKNRNLVKIDNLKSCETTFARCCNPLPGDNICAFMLGSSSSSIHKVCCVNVPKNNFGLEESHRWIKACWKKNIKSNFRLILEIHSTDKEGILADLTLRLSLMNVPIRSLNTRALLDDTRFTNCVIMVENLKHLKKIIAALEKIKGIISIKRV